MPAKITLSLRKKPSAAQVLHLYRDAPWARTRTTASISKMLKASQLLATAWQGKELVGMARAFSDGVYRAVLWDVIVDSPHRGMGLGKRLVRELMKQNALKNVEQVWLYTRNYPGFYKSMGFQAAGKGVLIKRKQ